MTVDQARDQPLASVLRAALAAAAHLERAAPTQACMKSSLPFLGVDAPSSERR